MCLLVSRQPLHGEGKFVEPDKEVEPVNINVGTLVPCWLQEVVLVNQSSSTNTWENSLFVIS